MSRAHRQVLRLPADPPARAVEFVDLDNDGCKEMLMLFSGDVPGQVGSHTSLLVAHGKKNGNSDCP